MPQSQRHYDPDSDLYMNLPISPSLKGKDQRWNTMMPHFDEPQVSDSDKRAWNVEKASLDDPYEGGGDICEMVGLSTTVNIEGKVQRVDNERIQEVH